MERVPDIVGLEIARGARGPGPQLRPADVQLGRPFGSGGSQAARARRAATRRPTSSGRSRSP